MENKIKDLRQQLLNFEFNKSFNKNDFFVSESNYYAYNLLLSWPKWDKKIINIYGERYSGKTHLIEIFLEKNKGLIIDLKKLKNYDLDELRFNENIIIENISDEIDESLFYSFIDTIDKYNKFLILTSNKPLNDFNFKLNDLKSRIKNCLFAEIEKHDDILIQALITKNLADYQITIDSKLIDFISKRITRSFTKIREFICTIDEISLKKKKPINMKIIKDILEDKIENI
jgi:chromosomal replication initiation ATPase DnaA